MIQIPKNVCGTKTVLQFWDPEPGDVTLDSWVGKIECTNEQVFLVFPDGAWCVEIEERGAIFGLNCSLKCCQHNHCQRLRDIFSCVVDDDKYLVELYEYEDLNEKRDRVCGLIGWQPLAVCKENMNDTSETCAWELFHHSDDNRQMVQRLQARDACVISVAWHRQKPEDWISLKSNLKEAGKAWSVFILFVHLSFPSLAGQRVLHEGVLSGSASPWKTRSAGTIQLDQIYSCTLCCGGQEKS